MTTRHFDRTPTTFGCSSACARTGGTPALTTLVLFGVLACTGTPPPETPVQAEVEATPELAPAAPPEEPMPESVVQAELMTSSRGLHAKGKFLLAVRFRIEQGYRISWSNPGDVGQSTRVRFEVPEGFVVGPTQFPAPTRFELPGGLVSYGYETETAVFAEVTAPERLSSSKAYRFDVRADWLACKLECATEQLEAWFELPANPRLPAPELPAELSAHYEAVPKSFSELPSAGHDWKGTPRGAALTLRAPAVKWVDFFPGDADQPKLVAVKSSGSALNLKFDGVQAEKPLRGVAVGELSGKAAFFDVTLPWPSN